MRIRLCRGESVLVFVVYSMFAWIGISRVRVRLLVVMRYEMERGKGPEAQADD